MINFARTAVVLGSCAVALAAAASPASAEWTAPQELPNTARRYPLFAAYGAGGATSIGMYGPLALIPRSPQGAGGDLEHGGRRRVRCPNRPA
jgi:hypothetical protein